MKMPSRRRSQLEEAVKPVREALREAHGDEFVVYRSQRPVESGAKPRNVLSYTLDKKFVKYHSGIARNLKRIAEKQILKAEKELQETGKTTVGSHDLRKEQITIDKGAWKGEAGDTVTIDLINLYDKGTDHHITDTTGVRETAKSFNEFVDQIQSKNIKAAKQIQKRKVNVDDVVWATNRAGQWEVMLKPEGAE